ncbi:VWA domain-containing protein [Streptomyces sp. CG1]|uniref:VWA domain-containing protein n=1 Tax=Streptomyces sp. CG1 TaxID=1287523 RepID=UPI0034E1ADF7
MGILTLLRNAFGRSRKARAAEAEGADRLPAQPTTPQPTPTTVPEPRRSSPDEHELVSAAFDNIQVPHPTNPTEPPPAPLPPATETAEAENSEPQTPDEQPTEQTSETETEAADEDPAEERAEAQAVDEVPAEEKPEAQADDEVPAEEKPEAQADDEVPAEEKPEAETSVAEKAEAEQAEPEAEAQAVVDVVTAEADEAAVPRAADGEDTPQGPPAPDNETRTGGAGGNTKAESEAEDVVPVAAEPEAQAIADTMPAEAEEATAPRAADGEDTPQAPPAPDNETRTDGAGGNTDAEGEAEANPAPTPATPLTKVKSRTPSLTTAYKAATATLKKADLTGTRAKLYLVLDRSASMRPYYKDGSAQALADQTLALAAHLDPEATVHVVFFSTEIDGTTDLALTPDHETKIDDVHAALGRMGRTSYHAAVDAVLTHHDKNSTPDTPALVVFQTDGAPDAKTPATQSLTAAATTHPAVFFSFVAFGDHDNKAFDYLRKLKTDNTAFFHAGPTPRELTDTELYEGVLAAWRP